MCSADDSDFDDYDPINTTQNDESDDDQERKLHQKSQRKYQRRFTLFVKVVLSPANLYYQPSLCTQLQMGVRWMNLKSISLMRSLN
jgi:hypothetical protein